MDTRTIKVNDKDYVFICRSARNRSGFTHDCEMKVGGRTFTCHAQYYNRTWEPYTYHSVMCGALYDLRSSVERQVKEEFLESRGAKRLSPKMKPDYEMALANNPQLKEIAEVRKELDHNSPWW